MTIGFCVIYRWRVVPGREAQFQEAWETVTQEIRDHEGGFGSRLHRATDGTWVAYAQWPDREAWEAAGLSTDRGRAAMELLSAAVEERMEPTLLDPIADYLVPACRDA